jgi:hypothetical protein
MQFGIDLSKMIYVDDRGNTRRVASWTMNHDPFGFDSISVELFPAERQVPRTAPKGIPQRASIQAEVVRSDNDS